MRRRLARFLAATLVVAATGSGALAGPSAAAACSSDTGVTVVVDFHQLGGGVAQACDAAGTGKSAAALFADNGFPLIYVQRQPGFVCRVSGKPAADPCVNTPPSDAYWSLFWSDGTSGTWSYAAQGVGSLTVPDGGAVAFSWQGSSTKTPPGVAPPTPAKASPSPSSPSKSSDGGSGTRRTPSATGSGSPSSPGESVSASGSPGAAGAADKSRRPKPSRSPSATASDLPSEVTESPAPAAASTVEPPADAGGSVPGWILLVVLAGLALAAVATAATRARGSRPS